MTIKDGFTHSQAALVSGQVVSARANRMKDSTFGYLFRHARGKDDHCAFRRRQTSMNLCDTLTLRGDRRALSNARWKGGGNDRTRRLIADNKDAGPA